VDRRDDHLPRRRRHPELGGARLLGELGERLPRLDPLGMAARCPDKLYSKKACVPLPSSPQVVSVTIRGWGNRLLTPAEHAVRPANCNAPVERRERPGGLPSFYYRHAA
jgi:hypothetical protein